MDMDMDLPEYNIIFLGNTNVGKTTLFNAFKSGKADSVPVIPTAAPTCQNKKVSLSNGENIIAQIWDTAGQETFKSITKTYFRNANVAIICFDKDGFDSIMGWIEDVREVNTYCHFVITLTKIDAIEQNIIDNIEKNVKNLIKNRIDDRIYTNEENDKNDGNQTFFIPTSGKSMTNVDELFRIATDFYLVDGDINKKNNSSVKIGQSNENNEKQKCC